MNNSTLLDIDPLKADRNTLCTNDRNVIRSWLAQYRFSLGESSGIDVVNPGSGVDLFTGHAIPTMAWYSHLSLDPNLERFEPWIFHHNLNRNGSDTPVGWF